MTLIFIFTRYILRGEMLVCHCHGITDRTIRQQVREGAVSSAQVSRRCGAGSRCGGCRPRIRDLVREELAAGTVAREPDELVVVSGAGSRSGFRPGAGSVSMSGAALARTG